MKYKELKPIGKSTVKSVIAGALLCSLSAPLSAGEPNASELDAAIMTGDFAGYLAGATVWLNQKTPAKPDESALATLLKDPVFRTVLDQRQLIAKTGADKLGAFARADPAHREFLGWLFKNTPAMDLYLEGVVPIGLAAREADKYTLDPAALAIWEKILAADPDAREGIYLKLAIATVIQPPGSINIGAGGAATPAAPVVRYKYYKTAHQQKALFPSFDHLTVWEYTRVVSSGASDADLTWARDMINTFRPDLRAHELVVNSTSLVWRRGSPIPYANSFKNVLAGGGKCGPRSSWSVMICQAFGIPAIGVGQPKHACVAYKADHPLTPPQPGCAWKVGFGGGWPVSKLLGLSGPEFLAGVEKRSDPAKFSQVEHLRWLAGALTAADRAAVVMDMARKINDSITAAKAGVPKDTVAAATGAGSTVPIKAVDGVRHVEAAAFVQTGGRNSWGGQVPHVLVHDCFTGGRQVYFQQQMKSQWADYIVEVPVSGIYKVVMQAACINTDQALEVCSGTNVIATVSIPLSYGLWQETAPVELKLEKGVQTLRVQTSPQAPMRGIALRWFDLKTTGPCREPPEGKK